MNDPMNERTNPPTDDVAFEPCGEFRLGLTDDDQICEGCGWLPDEHDGSVIMLPRATRFPARRAS